MRYIGLDVCKEKLKEFNVNPKVKAIEIGGAPRVVIERAKRRNPIMDLSPGIEFLDEGWLTDVDYEVDFLDRKLIMPLATSYDLVYCFYTLEHVRDPFLWCKHLLYITKPGGHVYLSTVFIAPYHHLPQDYFRFTHFGLQLLFENLPCEILWAGKEDHKGVAILVRKNK